MGKGKREIEIEIKENLVSFSKNNEGDFHYNFNVYVHTQRKKLSSSVEYFRVIVLRYITVCMYTESEGSRFQAKPVIPP
jgi:hypothetical protein